MRKIRIFEHISLDGVIAPGGLHADTDYGNGGWTAAYRTPEGAMALADAYGNGFDLLLGRRTYDLWSGFWPKIKGGPFADGINVAKKFVVTHRPESLAWGPSEPIGGDFVESVRQVIAGGGPDLILCGSSTLTSPLLEAGLVDEVTLIVYPVLFGTGKRVFSQAVGLRELALVSTASTPTGLVVNRYRHVGPLQPTATLPR